MSRVPVDTLFSDVRAHGQEERTCSKRPYVETMQARRPLSLGYKSNMPVGRRDNLHYMKCCFTNCCAAAARTVAFLPAKIFRDECRLRVVQERRLGSRHSRKEGTDITELSGYRST
jgi:hypothetical protein